MNRSPLCSTPRRPHQPEPLKGSSPPTPGKDLEITDATGHASRLPLLRESGLQVVAVQVQAVGRHWLISVGMGMWGSGLQL